MLFCYGHNTRFFVGSVMLLLKAENEHPPMIFEMRLHLIRA